MELPAKQHCFLAGSSKTTPRIFIFSIILGAEYSSYVKSIETHARAFLPLNISAVGSVSRVGLTEMPKFFGNIKSNHWKSCNVEIHCFQKGASESLKGHTFSFYTIL